MIKLTPQELKNFLKKPEDKEKHLPKQKLGINVKESILKYNQNCQVEVFYNSDYISIIFNNTKLLSLNDMFSILQYRKYELFAYKKMWQELIFKALENKPNLPKFSQDCEIVLFRQSAKLVDNDSLSVMFKFIIDALKLDKKLPNKPFVISEDNPSVIHNIKLIQEKSKENIVAIRLQRNTHKTKSSLEEFKKLNFIY